MKRILSILSLLLVSLSICAYDFMFNGIAYKIKANNEVEVTYSDEKYSGDITIPEKVEYNGKVYNVTSIGDYAFKGCSGLTSVALPNSISVIGKASFEYCHGITSITIPSGVTYIGQGAFSYTLTTITILSTKLNSKLTVFGEVVLARAIIYVPSGYIDYFRKPIEGTFYGNLADIREIGKESDTYFVEDGVRYRPLNNKEVEVRFNNNEGVITIPEKVEHNGKTYSVTTIGYSAFERCPNLSSVIIPQSVTVIGNRAFYGCPLITSITIPQNVIKLGERACEGCTSLNYVASLNQSPPTIWYNTFSDETKENATLYIPIGCRSAYGRSSWNFQKIMETDFSSSETSSTNLIVKFNNGSKKEYNMDDIESVDFSSE